MIGVFKQKLIIASLYIISSAEPNYCLVFQDDFNGPLDSSSWMHDISLGGGGNNEFQYYTDNATNSYTKDGVLYMTPTFTSDTIGEAAMINGGTLDLNKRGCTPEVYCFLNSKCCKKTSDGTSIVNYVSYLDQSYSIVYGKDCQIS